MAVKIKYTWRQFEVDCKNLIRRVRYADFKPATIVGVATGGLPLGTKLKNKLNTPLVIISAESYKGKQKGDLAFNVSFTKPLQSPVLLIDDIVDTGSTLKSIYNYISSLGIKVKTATLFYKERSTIRPDWYMNKVESKKWVSFCWE